MRHPNNKNLIEELHTVRKSRVLNGTFSHFVWHHEKNESKIEIPFYFIYKTHTTLFFGSFQQETELFN